MTATTIADNISKMLFYIFHLLNFVLSICDNDFFSIFAQFWTMYTVVVVLDPPLFE